jgi:PAS domain S-box-containing protein
VGPDPAKDQSLNSSHEKLIAKTQELEQALLALRSSDAFSRAIVDNAADGIVTIDDRGIIYGWNAAAEQIFGYQQVEAIGLNVGILMFPPTAQEHDQYLRRYLASGEKNVIDRRREVLARHKDGRSLPIDLHVSQVQIRGQLFFIGLV